MAVPHHLNFPAIKNGTDSQGTAHSSSSTPEPVQWADALNTGRVEVAAEPQTDAIELLCLDTRPLPREGAAAKPRAASASLLLLPQVKPAELPRQPRVVPAEGPEEEVEKSEGADTATGVQLKPYLLDSTRSLQPVGEKRPVARTAVRQRFVSIVIPEFAAWVAGQAQPALKQVPYVVAHRNQVLASSPLALAAGVQTGQSVGRAQARCPQVAVLNRDAAREELAWGEVQRLVYGVTSQLEAVRPGLIFAAMTADAVGQLGPVVQAWRARMGVADDRATAHLAALTAGAGVTRTVGPGRSPSFARQIPVTALCGTGISADVVQRLEWFGWKSVGALRVLSRRQMEEQFSSQGELLWQYAVGGKCEENLRPVAAWTPPVEVGSRLVLELSAREPAEWEGALQEVLSKASLRLGVRRAQSLELCVETVLGTFSSRRLLREPVAGCVGTRPDRKTLERLLLPARAALEEALSRHPALAPVVTGFEVRLGALTLPAGQTSLFEGIRCPGDRGPATSLLGVMESLARRFPNTFGRYVPQDSYSPFPEDLWSFEAAHRQLLREGRSS